MTEFNFQWITGMMLGIEFPGVEDYPPDENVTFVAVLDLLIVRLVVINRKVPEKMA